MNRILIAGLAGLTLLSLGCSSGSKSDQGAKSDTTFTANSESESTMPTGTMQMQNIPFNTITGQPTSLAAYAGKVVLIVNVASDCGYTPQYADLQKLYEQYKDKGLVILGFPANNFGGQEPGTNEQILEFCTTNFGVTFPMMAKVSVLGTDKHPLFVELTEKSVIPGEIKWNFGKFLLDRNGKLVGRYGSETEPMAEEIVSKIESLL